MPSAKTRTIKVVYACPFAHYAGHHPHVATVEPEILQEYGVDVTLLTFCGIIDNIRPRVKSRVVIPACSLHNSLLKPLRRFNLIRWFVISYEFFNVVYKAHMMGKHDGYDVVFLRDGEPYPFLPHIFKGGKWVISLTAGTVFTPAYTFKQLLNPVRLVYKVATKVVNSRFWGLVYRWSSRHNSYRVIVQNERAKKVYDEYLGGAYGDRVSVLALPISHNGRTHSIPQKGKAREQLGIPADAFVCLSFGAPHSGKDMATLFSGVSKVYGAYLLHGGTHAFGLGEAPGLLRDRLNLGGRSKLYTRYITEDEKPLFFAAADVLVLSYTKAFSCTSSMVWEAALYRLPVIASGANTLGEQITSYKMGLTFEPEDAFSLAQAIGRYMAMPKGERDAMVRGCVRFTLHHLPAAWAKGCEKLFLEVISEPYN